MKSSKNNTPKKKALMSDAEVAEMQRKIDQGIHLAQERLIERAKHNHATLIIARNNKIVEVKPEEL